MSKAGLYSGVAFFFFFYTLRISLVSERAEKAPGFFLPLNDTHVTSKAPR